MTWILALASGLAMALAFPPWGYWPLSFIGAALLIACLLRSSSARQAAALALLARLLFISMTLGYFRGLGALVHAAVCFPVIWPWLGVGLGFHWARRARGEVTALAMLPFLWVFFEWLGGQWHFLPSHITSWGTIFAETPLLRLAPALGLYGLSYLAAALSVAPWICVAAWRHKDQRRSARAAVLVHGIIALIPALLTLTISQDGLQAAPGAVMRVATVTLSAAAAEDRSFDDPKIPWTPERRAAARAYAASRLEAIRRQAADLDLDLLILPEDTIDISLETDPSPEVMLQWGIENNAVVIEAVSNLARALKCAVAVGMTTLRRGRSMNSVLMFGREGNILGLRDKFQLAAGSEYWPASSWIPYSRLFKGNPQFVEPDDQYTPAAEPFTLLRLGSSRVGALICLEGHTPWFFAGYKRAGADFLILLSNAQWFHLNPRAYNQHVLNLARNEAASNALPIFLSGKSSVFGFIDEKGRARVDSGEVGADGLRMAVHEFPSHRRRNTPIGVYGDYFIALSVLGAALLFLGRKGF